MRTFRLYPHNPPLVKLIAALPVLAARPSTQLMYLSSFWLQEPPYKEMLAHIFAEQNAERFFDLFARARLVMPLFAVVGGLVVLAWATQLYGRAAGLFSLTLWAFCPNVLAHTRLITTDVAATCLWASTMATWMFWRYLKAPSWRRAILTGLCLGLAELSKFTLVLLYAIWPFLGLIDLRSSRLPHAGRWQAKACGVPACVHGLGIGSPELAGHRPGLRLRGGRHAPSGGSTSSAGC